MWDILGQPTLRPDSTIADASFITPYLMWFSPEFEE